MGAEPPKPGADAVIAGFCRWCGSPLDICDESCRRDLDPPRACPTCGRRLRVVVIPTGFTAACREHGPITDA